MNKTCKTCKWAKWELTAKGNPRYSLSGKCVHPLDLVVLREQLNARLPACVPPFDMPHRQGIWPDLTNCVTWEPK